MSVWQWMFWLATAYVIYTYLGYPALLLAWRRLTGARTRQETASATPFVSIIVTCRNEEQSIGPKLEDLLAQDYPQDRMEIWVASDQSTDRTNEIVREFMARDSRVRLMDFQENIGKSVAINRTVPHVRGEVIISSDARQRVAPDAVRLMARHFADPKVGVVGAEMTLVNAQGEASSECTGLYWKYERSLRKVESDLDLLAGVSGAFFAMRRGVFRDIPPGSYCEDVTVCLYARSRRYTVRWEPGAKVYEVMRDPYTEFRRKVRTLVGNYQLLCQFWPMYLPWRGRLAFTLISHKVCRLFIPLGLALIFTATCALALTHPFYFAALLGQTMLYGAGGMAMLQAAWRRSKVVNACGAFCMLNWAALVAMFHVMRHGPRIQWR
jgi:poly-beta-1,6-N-acetyl-D-glucosamine synthase